MEKKIFKRKLYDKLLDWKRERQGASAALIEGARRVGKSTLAEEFAKNEYEAYILIDFIDAPEEIRDLFNDISNLDELFMQLQFHYKTNLIERKSVIVFDEVQNCPKARQAIRKLVQDRRYDYIETGSLISIKKNVKNIRIPSEETRFTLYPLDYEEFNWALEDHYTIPKLREFFEERRFLGDALTRKLMRAFRLYMLVGGMPQALNEYITTKDLEKVDAIKREIIDLYADDFRKIDGSGRATRLFYSIPSQLSSNASRYMLSGVIENEKHDRIGELIQEMEDSHVVLVSRHADDPNVGFPLHSNIGKYKLFLNDTGLFITLAFRDKSVTENLIYQKLLADKLAADLGYVYENVVAQMLKAQGNELFYYTWPTDSGKHNYEIDFLLSRKNKICPIEVKSSGYKSHPSLDAFIKKYSSRILTSYLLYTKDLRREGDVILLPVFMAMFL